MFFVYFFTLIQGENMGIYDNIKLLCKQKGITVKQMEETLDITRSSVCRWNNNPPTLNSIIKVANYFNVSIDGLVGRDIKYSDEQAMLDAEISEDFELKEAIKKYYTLDDRKKKHILELIDLFAEE